jgi:transcriptional regulator with XRE-family HTH domain
MDACQAAGVFSIRRCGVRHASGSQRVRTSGEPDWAPASAKPQSANAARVSQSLVSKVESGTLRSVSLETLVVIADAVGLDIACRA